jgi:hypothetical protein
MRLVTHVSIGGERGGSGQSGAGVWRERGKQSGMGKKRVFSAQHVFIGDGGTRWETSQPVSSGEVDDLV